jgi:hypothetical protein
MQCEECQKNGASASVHLTVIANNEKREGYLCESCAGRQAIIKRSRGREGQCPSRDEHDGDERQHFLTLYEQGTAWLPHRGIEGQIGWTENLAYWKAQAKSARMRFIGAIAGPESRVLALWYVPGVDEAKRLGCETPLVLSGVLRERTLKGGLAA